MEIVWHETNLIENMKDTVRKKTRSSRKIDDPPWSNLVQSREQQRRIKREAVLRTGAFLFAERGYQRTTLDDIADELRITKRTLYYYIDSKGDILVECNRYSRAFLKEVETIVADTNLSSLQKIEKMVMGYLGWLANDYGACLVRVGDDYLPDESRSVLQKGRRFMDHSMRKVIEDGIKQGTIADCDSKYVTAAIFGACNWLPHWYRKRSEESYHRFGIHFLKLFVYGLEATQPG